jgi:hypothetical protein
MSIRGRAAILAQRVRQERNEFRERYRQARDEGLAQVDRERQARDRQHPARKPAARERKGRSR